jgi:hypothetical protein
MVLGLIDSGLFASCLASRCQCHLATLCLGTIPRADYSFFVILPFRRSYDTKAYHRVAALTNMNRRRLASLAQLVFVAPPPRSCRSPPSRLVAPLSTQSRDALQVKQRKQRASNRPPSPSFSHPVRPAGLSSLEGGERREGE